jgi:hypothetical protein
MNCDLDGDKFICQEAYPASSSSLPAFVDQPTCCVSTMPSVVPELDNCGGSRPTGLPFATRSPILAQRGMAATSQPLSTQAALDILKLGGNAVEAAIAANAMEGVVEPMMCGLGGDLMAIVWDPKTGKLQGINSSGRASKTLSYDQMKQLVEDLAAGAAAPGGGARMGGEAAVAAATAGGSEAAGAAPDLLFLPEKGPLSVSVPGAAAGWCFLFDRFGSGNVTLAQVRDASAFPQRRQMQAVRGTCTTRWCARHSCHVIHALLRSASLPTNASVSLGQLVSSSCVPYGTAAVLSAHPNKPQTTHHIPGAGAGHPLRHQWLSRLGGHRVRVGRLHDQPERHERDQQGQVPARCGWLLGHL